MELQLRRIFWTFIVVTSILIGIMFGVLYTQLSDLPNIRMLEEYRPFESSKLYSDDGRLVAEFYIERRTVIPLSKIPKYVKDAIIAVEDSRFYSHSGIDLFGIIRAILVDIRERRIVEGGSTITQQLARRLFLKPEKTISRKIKEAILSLQIEKRYTKDEILELYLNNVYFGSGAYGVETASQTYFGKSASELTFTEAATLAGLPKAPNIYSPIKNPEKAKVRRNHVLRRMVEENYITMAQAKEIDAEPIKTKTSPYGINKAPYFVEYVRQKLEETFGYSLRTGGLNIYTTLNLEMQEAAEEAVRKGLKEISQRIKWKDAEIQGALIAIDPKNGHIKAMVGGTDFYKTQFNRTYQAMRQAGSAFKPFVFVTALDGGFTASDILIDEPIEYPGGKPGEIWSPKNFSEEFQGPVTLRKALAESINIIAIKLASKVGITTVIDYAKRLGIKSELHPYPSLALGSSDLTLMELTSAFGVFANIGIRNDPEAITKITDRKDRLIENSATHPQDVIIPETAYLITNLLRGVVEHGTGWRAKELGRLVAGKTGTTNEYNDAWFIGYTPNLVAGVWVGFDDHRKIGEKETGARAALPIWLYFMKKILKHLPYEDFKAPPDIVFIPVDKKTGRPSDIKDKNTIIEAFLKGTEPKFIDTTPQDVKRISLPPSPSSPTRGEP
ncbi:MAG: PBP1A family penicillin-binding protein [Nitrospirota bacterium]